MTQLFEADDLSIDYRLGDVGVPALKKLNFSIPSGLFTCLVGPSGSGKSTLLNVLGFIEPLQRGQLKYFGRQLSGIAESELNQIRRFEVGFVFQNFHLIDVLSAFENVEYFLARQGVPRKQRVERVRESLACVGLLDHAQKRPNQMSGGQRQRVALARALAKQPKVLIADEHTANLDSSTGAEVLKLLITLSRERGCSVVMASHDRQAIDASDRRIFLKDGQLVEGE